MKTEKQGKFTIMTGSDGGLDYAIFAQNGSFAIGVRPLFQAHNSGSLFAIRIRAVHYAEGAESLTAKTPEMANTMAKNILEAFPGFTFEKIGHERCSTVSTIECAAGAYQFDKIKEWYKGQSVATMFVDALVASLGGTDMVVAKKELIGWMDTKFQELFVPYEEKLSASAQATEQMPSAVINLAEKKAEKVAGVLSDEGLAAEAAELANPAYELGDEDSEDDDPAA